VTRPAQWIVLDRDGVINADSDRYIKSVSEWKPLPGSLEAIAALCRAGYTVAVASNQSGVGRGLFGAETLADIHAHMDAEVRRAGGRLAGIYVCPHAPADHCDCRKPRVGLLRQIELASGQSLIGVPIIGDKQSDIDAARAVGGRPILVRTGKGRATEERLGSQVVEVYPDLAAAVTALLGAEHP
jgi:D-glycero-D-manno-heptose 1,7-bisphosphate phosphatase